MNSSNKFFSAKGMSLVELSFLLPVVFLFIFAGVEFSRTIRLKILAQNLSRELTNTLMRECVGYRTDDTAAIRDCINRYQATIGNVANTLAPGSRVYGSIYRTGPTRVCQTNAPLPGNFLAGTTETFPSRFSTNCTFGGPFTLDSSANQVDLTASGGSLEKAGIVCAAEVYIPYTAILGFIPGYFRYNPTFFYAANII